jgi:hypothetical protein
LPFVIPDTHEIVLPFTVAGRARPANVTEVAVALNSRATLEVPIVPVHAPANFAAPPRAFADVEPEWAAVFAATSGSFDFGFAEFLFGLAWTSGVAVGVAGTAVEGAGIGVRGAGVGVSGISEIGAGNRCALSISKKLTIKT